MCPCLYLPFFGRDVERPHGSRVLLGSQMLPFRHKHGEKLRIITVMETCQKSGHEASRRVSIIDGNVDHQDWVQL